MLLAISVAQMSAHLSYYPVFPVKSYLDLDHIADWATAVICLITILVLSYLLSSVYIEALRGRLCNMLQSLRGWQATLLNGGQTTAREAFRS